MQPARNTTRIFAIFCAGLFAVLGATISSAQPAIPAADLARCAAIATDAVRLACFDALAHELGPEGNLERAASEPADEALATAMPEAENEDAFGAELIGDSRTRGPDEIQSRLIGEFTGWRGNAVFRLENGQVWRQADSDRLAYAADSPLVTIRRGAFGTYRLTVEGLNRSTRVRRIE